MKKSRLEIVSEQLWGCDYKKQAAKKKSAETVIKNFIVEAIKKKQESKSDSYYCLSHDYHISELKQLEKQILQLKQ